MMHRSRTVREPEALNPLRDFHGNRFEKAIAIAFLWMRQNRGRVLLLAGSILIVGFAGVGFLIYRDYVERKSLHEWEELLKNPVMASGSGAEKVAIEKIEKYEANFNNDHARIRAGLKRVELLVKTGETEKAADTLLEISRLAETPELAALYAYRAGAYYEEKGKYAKSESAYSTAGMKLTEDSAPRALALFGQGRALILLGKEHEGREVFKRMMEIKDAENIGELRTAAAAFLIQHSSGK